MWGLLSEAAERRDENPATWRPPSSGHRAHIHPDSTSLTMSVGAAINSSPTEFIWSSCKFQSPDLIKRFNFSGVIKGGKECWWRRDGFLCRPMTSGDKKITLWSAKAAVFIWLSLGLWLTSPRLAEAENKQCLLGPWHCLLSVWQHHTQYRKWAVETQTWRQKSFKGITNIHDPSWMEVQHLFKPFKSRSSSLNCRFYML